jgi:hypothetical protein
MDKWDEVFVKAIPKGVFISTDDGIKFFIHDIYGDQTITEVTDPDEAMKIVENILEKRLTSLESGV